MRKLMIPFLLFLSICSGAQKTTSERLFINFGTGPSYSLFYHSGGWVRDFGSPNINNVTEKRVAWAFSHFAELEWRLKNDRWSLRGGYSMHHFHPEFKRTGVTANGTNYYIDTREADRYIYFQPTVHYALLRGRNKLEIGAGAYIQVNRRQGIDYYNSLSTGGTFGSTFIIDDYESSEAGFPFNIDYVRVLRSGNALGCRFNFNYTQSVQTAEHLALQLFFKAKLK